MGLVVANIFGIYILTHIRCHLCNSVQVGALAASHAIAISLIQGGNVGVARYRSGLRSFGRSSLQEWSFKKKGYIDLSG